MSNQLKGNHTHSLPTSTHSIKKAIVDKANKFITKQRREIARIKVQNHTKNQEKKRKKPVTPIKA